MASDVRGRKATGDRTDASKQSFQTAATPVSTAEAQEAHINGEEIKKGHPILSVSVTAFLFT